MLDRDVLLPGDPPAERGHGPRQGALAVVEEAGTWEVRATERGAAVLLARASDQVEALEFAVARATTPLPVPAPYPLQRLERAARIVADGLAPVRAHLLASPGTVVETTLPPGSVLDRVGALDGFLLYPARTPLAQRSLPPDALDDAAPGAGLTTVGVVVPVPVLVRIVEPWFGQPGGALVLRVAEAGIVVRDLVARGDLQVLSVTA